jgi:hypothetical protein
MFSAYSSNALLPGAISRSYAATSTTGLPASQVLPLIWSPPQAPIVIAYGFALLPQAAASGYSASSWWEADLYDCPSGVTWSSGQPSAGVLIASWAGWYDGSAWTLTSGAGTHFFTPGGVTYPYSVAASNGLWATFLKPSGSSTPTGGSCSSPAFQFFNF